MTDWDAAPIGRHVGEGMTVRGIEVEWEKYEDRYVFMIPNTLEKARSAYAYDPVFNTALTIFCDKKQKRPEDALHDNLGQLLHVDQELLTGVTRTGGEPMPEQAFSVEPTINDLKQMFVNDTINIEEFESRVEEKLR